MHHPSHSYDQRMDVTLRQLRALVAVVDEGTFTVAAVALRTTQASVSRAVAGLERALGVRLLQRTTRHVALTESGARVLRHAREVLAEVRAMQAVDGRGPGEIRVGYDWAALGGRTTEVQRGWAVRHPGSELVFVQSSSPTAGLAEGTADVAVSRRALVDPRVDSALVGHEPRVAALASGDPLARRRRLRLADLADRTVAVHRWVGTTTPALWPDGAAPRTRAVNGTDDWLTLIAAGRAVGLTSRATAVQHRRPGLAFRPVTDAPPIAVHLVWWREDPPSWLEELCTLIRGAYDG